MSRNTTICPDCGLRNSAEAATCADCGAALPARPPVAASPPAVAVPPLSRPAIVEPALPATTAAPQLTPVAAAQAVAAPALAANPGPSVSLDRPNYGEAIRFPFRQANWPERLWLPPLIFFLPFVNVIVMRGWRLEVARRLGRGWSDRLPEPSGFGRYLLDGLVLWLMTGLYLIPQFVLLLFFGFGPLGALLAVLVWLFTPERVSFFTLLGQIGFGTLLQALLPLVYWLVTYPLYRVAMVRYAYTGSVGVFFDVANNLNIARQHLGLVLQIYLFEQLSAFLFVVLCALLAPTVIGALAIPLLLFPALYWTTGYLFGSLAAVVQSRQLA